MKKAFQTLMGKKVKTEKPIEEEKPFVPNKRKGDLTDKEKWIKALMEAHTVSMEEM